MELRYDARARHAPKPKNRGATERESAQLVRKIDNHIYFYADVESEHCLSLIQQVREADTELRAEHLSRGMDGQPLTPIWLHINSYGGELFTGFALADQLPLIKSPVYGIVEGICASAATLIALSCSKRFILPSSFMLIHQLSSFKWGTHEQFKDEMTLQSKAMDRLVEFYARKTRVTAEEVRTMLARDYWLDAETAIRLGFAEALLA